MIPGPSTRPQFWVSTDVYTCVYLYICIPIYIPIYIYLYIYIPISADPSHLQGGRAREKVALRRLWRPSSMSYGHLQGAFPWPFSSMFFGHLPGAFLDIVSWPPAAGAFLDIVSWPPAGGTRLALNPSRRPRLLLNPVPAPLAAQQHVLWPPQR